MPAYFLNRRDLNIMYSGNISTATSCQRLLRKQQVPASATLLATRNGTRTPYCEYRESLLCGICKTLIQRMGPSYVYLCTRAWSTRQWLTLAPHLLNTSKKTSRFWKHFFGGILLNAGLFKHLARAEHLYHSGIITPTSCQQLLRKQEVSAAATSLATSNVTQSLSFTGQESMAQSTLQVWIRIFSS